MSERRQVIRSGAWRADWHVLDLSRQYGDDWSYTLCRLMLRPVEQGDMAEPGHRDGIEPSCPLCVAELAKEAGPSSS